MSFLMDLPLPWVAVAIFFLRCTDVSLGTVRTLAIVTGRTVTAMALGFVEVLIWITVVSQVVARIHESPWVAVAFAGGFAAGNGVGIFIERRLAFGDTVLRIISPHGGPSIAEHLRDMGQAVTTFTGAGRDGPVTLLYAACARRRVPELIRAARSIDPDLFYTTERADSVTLARTVIAQPSGWRAFWKKK